MLVCCTSDLHGNLPTIPPCDLLLIAGDISPAVPHKTRYHAITSQLQWIKSNFNPWLAEVRQTAKPRLIAITLGNHDWFGQSSFDWGLDCEVLIDRTIEFEGLTIHGSPWTKTFFDWAFMRDVDLLAEHHRNLPDVDILITHGPPYGFGDYCADIKNQHKMVHVGCPALMERIVETEPMLAVFGHIHKGFGTRVLGNTILANVSLVNNIYNPAHVPQLFNL